MMPSAAEDFAPYFVESRGVHLRVAAFAAAPARGLCVLLNGQTEFIEKYFEVIDELRARGFSVATMDWRGQGGSSRLLADPLKGHVADFSDYDADLNTLLGQVAAPLQGAGKAPIALAHSMGGHNLLRLLHARSSAFSACVFSAPMIGISPRGKPPWLVPLASRTMNMLGRGHDFVWGMGQRDPLTLTFAQQMVTSDPRRFARTMALLKTHPELRLAGPSWGWLAAAYRSLARMNALGYARAIATPALICGAGRDRICVSAAAKDFAARMPQGDYLELDDSEHEILMERDSIRARFWNAFDAFIANK
jgi:lysophospholipase